MDVRDIVQVYAPNKLFLLDLIDTTQLANCLHILLKQYDEDGLRDTPRGHGRIGRLLLKMGLQSVYEDEWKDVYRRNYIPIKPHKLIFETRLPRYIYATQNYYRNAVQIYHLLEKSGIQHPIQIFKSFMNMCSGTSRKWLTISRKFLSYQVQIIRDLKNNVPLDVIIQRYLR